MRACAPAARVGVDIEWRDGLAQRARLTPRFDAEQIVRAPRAQRIAAVTDEGTAVPFSSRSDGTVTVRLAGRAVLYA